MVNWRALFPVLEWGGSYSRTDLSGDLTAAMIVTIMLLPQSLAYALLAGLPAEVGLYASITPLIIYAVFGTSRVLAVGPVAVVSLMTASALAPLELSSTPEYVAAAAVLALLSGGMLLLMGVLKLGIVANFLSHPVISGFITASGILISFSQLKHILGVDMHGHSLPELLSTLWLDLPQTNGATLLVGTVALASLFWIRSGLKPLLVRIGMAEGAAGTVARIGPVIVVAGTTLAAWALDLSGAGVAVVGQVPGGVPPIGLPMIDGQVAMALLGPALLISVIGYVESISVAQTLAGKRRQRIEPNQELVALGASNVAAGLSGGYAVTGGFARSVVNFDAGARTPAAGAFTAVGLLFAAMYLTPLLFFLPKATLAATIIVAVLSLIDLGVLKRAWAYSRADFTAVLATILLTLGFGVEVGVASGIAISLALFVWKTSRPHVAEVGRVPGSQHFRNILRHKVETDPAIVSLRIDESLYFANARRMEDMVLKRVQDDDRVRHVILMFSAVNEVDLSALESLEAIISRLQDHGVVLHLSEVKGPVMDRFQRDDLLEHLTGQVFLSQNEAFETLKRCVEHERAA